MSSVRALSLYYYRSKADVDAAVAIDDAGSGATNFFLSLGTVSRAHSVSDDINLDFYMFVLICKIKFKLASFVKRNYLKFL